MSVGQMIREEIDRLIRPGQPGTSVSAHSSVNRTQGGSAPAASGLTAADGEEGGVKRYAVYGRGRYDGARYR